MIRLLDLHAASCAGDTLVTLGLAGTVFISVSAGEARSRVALYLFITMLPFALVAPIVGPVLDRFRHGRRYALAATMLGRAFLAWLISDYIHGIGLYPAAFGVLLLSRAYGVARSAAVPRLLPASLGLSEAGARASLWGTLAGAVVAPLGAAAFWVGPQWSLRVASVIFVIGMVIALRLPPRADSDPPETVPRLFRTGRRALSGKMIFAVLSGGAVLRGVFGFLALFLAFAVRSDGVPTTLLGHQLAGAGALAVVGGALVVGNFLATLVGTRLRIRRPVLLQTIGLIVTAGLGVFSLLVFNLATLALLCLASAGATGLAKLAVDATIQEKLPEQVRASAFAHSETVLMLAWVAGGALGLIAFSGRVGIGIATAVLAIAAVRGVVLAGRLRGEKLRGFAHSDETAAGRTGTADEASTARETSGAGQTASTFQASTVPASNGQGGPGQGTGTSPGGGTGQGATVDLAANTERLVSGDQRRRLRLRSGRFRGRTQPTGSDHPAGAPGGESPTVPAPAADAPPADTGPGRPQQNPRTTQVLPADDPEGPGYHLYRPSGSPPPPGDNG